MRQNMGCVYWLTGLSGAGKTTIGRILYKRLCEKRDGVVFLDGDDLRAVFGNDLGYTAQDRKKSAMRNARLCGLLAGQGLVVVCRAEHKHSGDTLQQPCGNLHRLLSR